MKYSFESQALAVKIMREFQEKDNEDSIVASTLKEAEITLNALALIGETSILSASKLADIAKEIIQIVEENKGSIYDDQAVSIAARLKKILNSK